VTIVEDVTEELQVSASDSYAFVEDLFDEVPPLNLSLVLPSLTTCLPACLLLLLLLLTPAGGLSPPSEHLPPNQEIILLVSCSDL
jgi:hypothetical protein